MVDALGPEDDLRLFVYGCRRSGTTLLATLLSQHPDVHVLNDAGVLWALNRASGSRLRRWAWRGVARTTGSARAWARADASRLPPPDDVASLATVDAFYAELAMRYRPGASGGWLTTYGARLDVSDITARARRGELTVRGLVTTVHRRLLPDADADVAVLGEKTPEHLQLSPWLQDAYPHALHVVLIREPLTTIVAIRKRNYASTLRSALALYRSTYGATFERLVQDDRSVLIRYEDLVVDPGDVVAGIVERLGLEPSPVPESFAAPSRADYVGTGIDRSRDDRLRAAATPFERRAVRRTCSHLYDRYYPTTSE